MVFVSALAREVEAELRLKPKATSSSHFRQTNSRRKFARHCSIGWRERADFSVKASLLA